MVTAARKAIERLYKDSCSIIIHREYTKANKSTGFEDVTVLENQPCKLSYSTAISSLQTTKQTDTAAILTQKTKLFIAPEIIIAPGSKIVIIKQGRTLEFEKSGEPALLSTHQEITLELFKGWA